MCDMKKLLKALLTLALVITCICAVSVQTKAATVASGTCGANGGNLTWSLDDAGTLTISGSGAMKDYSYEYVVTYAPWHSYRKSIKKVVIQKGVTTIGEWAFYNQFREYSKLTSVSIPASVTAISPMAIINNTLFNVFSALNNRSRQSVPHSSR